MNSIPWSPAEGRGEAAQLPPSVCGLPTASFLVTLSWHSLPAEGQQGRHSLVGRGSWLGEPAEARSTNRLCQASALGRGPRLSALAAPPGARAQELGPGERCWLGSECRMRAGAGLLSPEQGGLISP